MSFPVLTTQRLHLRPLRVDDAAALHPVFADEDLMRWWSSASHKNFAETQEYVKENCEGKGWQTWAITMVGNEQALGWVVFIRPEYKNNVREIGFILSRSAWGKAIAREAVSRVIQYGFDQLDLRRIYADVDPDNIASIKLLEKLGFKQEGYLRQEWETHIGVRDSLIFGLLRDDWPRAEQ